MNHSRHGMRSLDVGQPRQNNNFGFRGYQNAEKLIEKYSKLAKEALSTGDKILSENYFQHADHFSRILSERENYKFLKDKDNNSQNTQVASKNVEETSKQEEIQEKETLKS